LDNPIKCLFGEEVHELREEIPVRVHCQDLSGVFFRKVYGILAPSAGIDIKKKSSQLEI
jgi:hypothetical protein